MVRSKARPTRIFFAADLHGSQPTFRKFLGAAAFYETDALVFGGDLMGKALVPIVRSNGGFRAHFGSRNPNARALIDGPVVLAIPTDADIQSAKR